MNILFIAMRFNNYEFEIKKEFESQGHKVTMIYDSPNKYFFPSRILSKNRKNELNEKYQFSSFENVKNESFDIVFAIVGRFLTENFLNFLKTKLKTSKFILYLWDDIKRVENFEYSKKYFDEIFSFDIEDCNQYGFIHLPLFYLNVFNLDSKEKKYDIYGCYWNHSDRIKIMEKIISDNSNRSMFFYIVLSKIDFFKYRLLNLLSNKTEKSFDYHISGISIEENALNMKLSNAILDIQFPSQKGLTIRTIESLGCGIKLITTNESVKQYDFYDENNICVIDRANPIIPENFFNREYIRLDEHIYSKYSLNSWVKSILEKK